MDVDQSTVDHDNVRELLEALFGHEFADGRVDYDTIEQIHRGDVAEWVAAVARSGLFGEMTVCAIGERWRREPKRLVELLVAEADEITKKRVSVTWAVLDRSAPLAHIS